MECIYVCIPTPSLPPSLPSPTTLPSTKFFFILKNKGMKKCRVGAEVADCIYTQQTFALMTARQRELFVVSSLCISCGSQICNHSNHSEEENKPPRRFQFKSRSAWCEEEEMLLREMVHLMPSTTVDYKVLSHHWKIRNFPPRTRKAFEIKISTQRC